MIITLTGPSGVGKTTIFGQLLRELPNFRLVSSHTTRQPRESDLPGEYKYYTDQEFEVMRSGVTPLWDHEFSGFQYLTSAESVLETSQHPNSIFGMLLIPSVIGRLKSFAELRGIQVMSVYILSPASDVLSARMAGRGESPESIQRRIDLSKSWDADAGPSGLYEYFITNNGSIDEAVQKVIDIIEENQPYLG